MKLRRLNRLNKEAVGQFGSEERITAISTNDLKSVLGGATIAAEAHLHYNYNGCTGSCSSSDNLS